jgi:F-type H+-transporting ATPase subunit b
MLHSEGDRIMFHRVTFCLIVLVTMAATASPVLASETAPGNMDSLNPLAPSAFKLDLALWTVVVFLLLLAILSKFAWGPLAKALDKREQNVANQIAQAEAANQQAKEILADYERKLAAAEDQVRAVIEQGRRDAEQVGRELIDKAKDEAKAEFQRAVKQIDAATSAAIEDLADRSAALAVELAGKIVRSKLNPGDHTRLIEQAVKGFVESKGEVSRN